jgi:hypothetical protein
MPKSRIRAGVALSLLAASLVITTGFAGAVGPHTAHARSSRAAATPATPTTWHVIAGFSQLLPTDSGNTEAVNPQVAFPIVPKDGVYRGGVASSGLTGNYVNLPGQRFLAAPFALTFARAGVYTYACLVHPGMAGTITVLPRGDS